MPRWIKDLWIHYKRTAVFKFVSGVLPGNEMTLSIEAIEKS